MLVQEQGLVFFSASGTPQMYKTRLLCSLLPLHGPSCWQMEDERRGQKGFFVVWSVLFFFSSCAQLVKFPWAIPEHPSTSVTTAKFLTEPESHNGISGGCRSQMQQANTTYFPRNEATSQARRKKDKLAPEHFFPHFELCSSSSNQGRGIPKEKTKRSEQSLLWLRCLHPDALGLRAASTKHAQPPQPSNMGCYN